jgi:hypothetical protein
MSLNIHLASRKKKNILINKEKRNIKIFELQSPYIIKMNDVHVDMTKKQKARARARETETHKHANL